MDTESPRLRLSILGIVVFSLFAALFARLWYLQIMAPDQGVLEAAQNRLRTIAEEAPRGRILDDKGRVLVDNRTSLEVTVDPHRFKELKVDQRADLLLRLASELTRSGVPTKVSTIQHRLDDPQYSPLQPIPVAIDVPDDLMVFLAERTDDFPSVQLRRESVRQYPQASLAAHVLGYVGRISDTELERRTGGGSDPKLNAKSYMPDSEIGLTGVENTFEDDLRGTPGVRTVEVDRSGKVVRELTDVYKKPIPGSDIQLSIDIDVQATTEEKLAEGLESRRGHFSEDGRSIITSPAGSAVVLDPRNGNVVAMASYPTYDPTLFVNGISTDAYAKLRDSPSDPLTNRAIGGLYAPGSTFKLVTASAALAKGVITAGTWYEDRGSFEVAKGVVLHNAEGKAHGSLQLPKAITVSSDVYFYNVGNLFWLNRNKFGDGIQEYAHAFGFGKPTGIDLPIEVGGVVPDPTWLKQYWESLPASARSRDGDKWYAGDSVNLAIGQGYMQATPLQIANAYAAFANHGDRFKPNLVTKVFSNGTDPNTANLADCKGDDDLAKVHCLIRTIAPVKVGHVDLPPEIFDPLYQGFSGVTTDPEGTAAAVFKGFDQKAFPVFGKTGTAQVNGKADNALFVAAGPATAPTFVASAVLEQAGFGATAAAPVIRSVFDLVSGQIAPPPQPATAAQTGPGTQTGPATQSPTVTQTPTVTTTPTRSTTQKPVPTTPPSAPTPTPTSFPITLPATTTSLPKTTTSAKVAGP